jgi:hypothetical protein
VKNVGPGKAAELATYVIEKGKPLVVLAGAGKQKEVSAAFRSLRYMTVPL